jgi:hypothetical protein
MLLSFVRALYVLKAFLYHEQCSKWKCRSAGILYESETGIYSQKKLKQINGYCIY